MKRTMHWEVIEERRPKGTTPTEKQLCKVWMYTPTPDDPELGDFIIKQVVGLEVRSLDLDLKPGKYAAGVARADADGKQLDATSYSADFAVPEGPSDDEVVILVPTGVTVTVPAPSAG